MIASNYEEENTSLSTNENNFKNVILRGSSESISAGERTVQYSKQELKTELVLVHER